MAADADVRAVVVDAALGARDALIVAVAPSLGSRLGLDAPAPVQAEHEEHDARRRRRRDIDQTEHRLGGVVLEDERRGFVWERVVLKPMDAGGVTVRSGMVKADERGTQAADDDGEHDRRHDENVVVPAQSHGPDSAHPLDAQKQRRRGDLGDEEVKERQVKVARHEVDAALVIAADGQTEIQRRPQQAEGDVADADVVDERRIPALQLPFAPHRDQQCAVWQDAKYYQRQRQQAAPGDGVKLDLHLRAADVAARQRQVSDVIHLVPWLNRETSRQIWIRVLWSISLALSVLTKVDYSPAWYMLVF